MSSPDTSRPRSSSSWGSCESGVSHPPKSRDQRKKSVRWKGSFLQQQDALSDRRAFVGSWTHITAEHLHNLHMPELEFEEPHNTQPQEKATGNIQEFEDDFASSPVIDQSVEGYNHSLESSPRPDTTTLTTRDIDEVLNSYNNTNVQTAARSRKRRTTQFIGQEAGEIRSPKRHHQVASLDPNKELEEASSRVVKLRTQGGDDTQAHILSCPFYKHDPHKYHLCLGHHFRRIKDVKQHIYRKHSKPDYYCSRCFIVFDDAASRDVHTRLAYCRVQIDPWYDSISAEQKKILAPYANRSKSIHDQWYEMWDTIFPREPRPKSVYVSNHFVEAVSLLRAFWDKQRLEIISSVGQAGGLDGTAADTINEVVETLMDHFEKEISGAVEQAAETTPMWPEAVANRRSHS